MGTPEPTWPGNQSEGCISHAKVVMLAGGVRVDVLTAGRVVHPTHTHTHTHRGFGELLVTSAALEQVQRPTHKEKLRGYTEPT